MMSENHLELGQEYPPEGEDALIEQVLEMSRSSMTSQQPVLRDQHPKSHGFVQGEFIVEDNISGDLKVGVFAEKKSYPVWIRFSNGSGRRDQDGNFLSDTEGDIRGMAIKLMNIEGDRAIENTPHKNEQDFILINSPIMFVRDVQGYIDLFPVLANMTINADGKPSVPEHLEPQFQAIAYAFPILNKIRAKKTSSPLKINYWSATPFKLGDHAMKYSVVPHSIQESFNPEDETDENYLRKALIKHLEKEKKDAYFDFKIQLQTDAYNMPVEDPTVEWDIRESPYIKVATIKIPAQNFNTTERKELDKQQSFSPWHSLLMHQPLGGVNRARKIYDELAQLRNEMNSGST